MSELNSIHKHLYEPELYPKEQLPKIYHNDIQYLIKCLTPYKRTRLTPEEITAMKSERNTLKGQLHHFKGIKEQLQSLQINRVHK